MLISSTYRRLTVAGLLITIVYFIIQDFIAIPWNDEICTADTPINYVLYGKWDSNLWHYTYNPLHAFLLIAWIRLFGVSHAIVCNLNVFLASISFFFIEYELAKRSFLNSKYSQIAFFLLFWLGFMISSIMTKGRIDMLVMLSSIGVYSVFLDKGNKKVYVKLFIWSFVMAMSSIYSIPLVIISGFVFFTLDYLNYGRYNWFLKCFFTGLGLLVAFILVCIFYWSHDFLYHFIGTFIRFNKNMVNEGSFFSRLFEAYNHDIIALLLCVMSWILLFITKKYNKDTILLLLFISLIPFIMTVVGRFPLYYVWMYELPISLYIVCLINDCKSHICSRVCITIIVLFSFARPAYWGIKRPIEYQERSCTESYIHSKRQVISEYQCVYFQDPICYYPLLATGSELYYLLNDNLYVNQSISDNLSKLPFLKNYKEYQPQSYLPEKGIMILTPKDNLDEKLEELEKHKFRYRIIDNSNNYSLTEFSK